MNLQASIIVSPASKYSPDLYPQGHIGYFCDCFNLSDPIELTCYGRDRKFNLEVGLLLQALKLGPLDAVILVVSPRTYLQFFHTPIKIIKL